MIQILQSLFSAYCQGKQIPQPDISKLELLLKNDSPFRDKWKALDEWFEQNASFEELEPYVFDLLVATFVNLEYVEIPDEYFESKEWQEIEEDMSDRGSEWLNLLVYLQDCSMNELEPELDDFLYSFLLVEEDEFQDEHEIYEPLIILEEVIEQEPEAIVEACRKSDAGELGPLLPAMLLYFNEKKVIPAGLTPLETGLLAASYTAGEYFEE
jgi:hypothetical protein